MFPGLMPEGVELRREWADLRARFVTVPDDTDLRIQYALEWEKNGLEQARAQLIRLQLRLADLPGVDHPEWIRLRYQAEDLLLDHLSSWTPAWFSSNGIGQPVMYRGFIEGVTAPISTLLNEQSWNWLFRSAPIRHLDIVGISEETDLGFILNRSELRQIVSLRLDGQHIGDELIRRLAESHLRNLRWLSLAHTGVTERGVDWLAEASGPWGVLRDLEFVDLTGAPGDISELIEEDQDIVVGRTVPGKLRDLESKHAREIRWLRWEVANGHVLHRSRFEYWRKGIPQ